MAELIILVFDDEAGALQARDRLLEIQQHRTLRLADAAVIVWQQDRKVTIKQLHGLVGPGAFSGAFWGLLTGLLLAAPWLGLAITGLGDYGIDDRFMQKVGDNVEPGRSALLLLVQRDNLVNFKDELKPFNPTILQTSLSDEDETKLRDAFGSDEIEA